MTKLYSLDLKDVSKALVMAVLTGAFLPVLAVFQTPGFNVATIDWHQLSILAINGAILGFVTYLTKNFFSNEQGQVVTPLGKIG